MLRWSSVDVRRFSTTSILWLLLGLASIAPIADRRAHADVGYTDFEVKRATLRAVDEGYVVDAHIRTSFSNEDLEAMRHGVALTVLVEIEILRERDGWWDEAVSTRQLRYRVNTNALTDRYQIVDPDGFGTRSYQSLDEMTNALGRLNAIPVLERGGLLVDQRYRARMRAQLDIEALPSPLRPIAYLKRIWHPSNGWFEWRISR